MVKLNTAIVIILGLLLVVGCGCDKAGDIAGIQIYPIPTSNDIDIQVANADVKTQLNSWVNDGYKLYFKETFIQNDKEKALLLLSKPENHSHAAECEIVGMILTFSEDKYKWQLEKKSDSIIRFGSYGNDPVTKLVRIGKDKFAIIFNGRYGNQGYYSNIMSLVAITDKGFEESLSTLTESDNSGTTSPKWSYNIGFELMPSNKEYYDIGVTLSGVGEYKKDGLDGVDKNIIKKLSNGKARLSYINDKYI